MPGQTTLRVRITYTGTVDPCGTTTYGEVEDYSVYVLGWLQVDNYGDTLQAGASSDINVTLDASDIDAGVYTADINISSNDPDMGMVTVPITLTVGENILLVDPYADPADICTGESTQLYANASGGSGSFTYSWTSVPEGFTSSEANPMVSPGDTTVYTVEVSDGIFTISDFTKVNVAPLPGVCGIPAGETVFCQNDTGATYATEGSDFALSYNWYLTPAEAGTISGDGLTSTVTWNAGYFGEAVVNVKGVNDCGEGELSENLVVTINPLPGTSATPTGETSICINSPNLTYTTAGADYATSYVWSLTPETAGSIGGDGQNGVVYWNSEFTGAASISVKALNDCGEGASSETLTVMINPLPEVNFVPAADSVCIYTPVFNLSSGQPSGGVYSGSGVLQNGGNYSFDPNGAGLGDHVLTYTYTDNNGCENFAQAVINVNECVGINEVVNGVHVEIYPNPNKGIFTVKFNSGKSQDLNMRILNNIGVEVYSESGIQSNGSFVREINLSSLSEGIYFIYLNSNETNYMRKIIVSK